MRLISVPLMPFIKYRNPEREVEWLRKMGAQRVYLCLGIHSSDMAEAKAEINRLKPHLEYFRGAGFEVGIWYWAFWLKGKNNFTRITGFNGKTDDFCCPSDPDFRAYMAELTREAGKLHPDVILLDDDLRYGYLPTVNLGCTCPRHRAMLAREVGHPVPDDPEELFKMLFSGKPNPERSAWLRVKGESLRAYCRDLRAALDSVAPEVRLGACACLPSYDSDGVDAFEIAHILAGSTKPLMRLISAPYWGTEFNWSYGYRLQDTMETERLERSWYDGDDIEIVSEGDAYPRPRFTCPSSYLEIFDTALLFSGRMNGIHKYTFDYSSSTDYETGYNENHIRNLPIYEKIEEITKGKDSVGLRVWEPMKKLENADFTGRFPTVEEAENSIISFAARTVDCHAIPTVYEGNGVAGIAFGESARSLPDSAFDAPLIVDLVGAKILTGLGYDLGLRAVGDPVTSQSVDFPELADAFTVGVGSAGGACALTLAEGAKTIGNYPESDNTPYAYTYEDKAGRKYLVLNFDGCRFAREHSRNYLYPRVIETGLARFGVKLPARIRNCPDLYMQVKVGEDGEYAIGIWNCSADVVRNAALELDFTPKSVVGISCEPTPDGEGVTIPEIPAFGFCFLTVR